MVLHVKSPDTCVDLEQTVIDMCFFDERFPGVYSLKLIALAGFLRPLKFSGPMIKKSGTCLLHEFYQNWYVNLQEIAGHQK